MCNDPLIYIFFICNFFFLQKDNSIQLFVPPAVGPQQIVHQKDFRVDAEVLCLCYQPVDNKVIQYITHRSFHLANIASVVPSLEGTHNPIPIFTPVGLEPATQ